MDSSALLMALKRGDNACVKNLLVSVDSSVWPVEILIPFVLREVLQSPKECADLSYIEKCFKNAASTRTKSLKRMFTGLQRLQDPQKREKSLGAMLKYKASGEIDKLGDYVMRNYQLVVRQYGGRRYGRQFRYLVLVCHRRSRLLDFQKRFHPLYSCVLGRLCRRSLSFVESLISVMIT
ncbi:hypothetical protein OSTOST_00712 [Ostertagia ostertagi]